MGQHDFNANPLCLVPFSISVENYLPENSTFWYKIGFNHHQDLGRFLGCTQASVPMLGQSKRQFQFHMTVSSPGLYCYQGLSFQMTKEGDELTQMNTFLYKLILLFNNQFCYFQKKNLDVEFNKK